MMPDRSLAFMVFVVSTLVSCASPLHRFARDAAQAGPMVPSPGTSHAVWLAQFTKAAAAKGYRVQIAAINDPLQRVLWGITTTDDQGRGVIFLNETLPLNGLVEALAHELGHVYDVRPQPLTRTESEVLAESVAFLLTNTIGLTQARPASVAYLANIPDGPRYLLQIAPLVEQIARDILQAAR